MTHPAFALLPRLAPAFAAGLCLLGSGVVGAADGPGSVSPHAGMLRYPDVSATHIVFSYANDLWIVPREGGSAAPLASPPGQELYPKFSPDGRSIAFVGNYDGNQDLYTISLSGGPSARVTHHPGTEILTGWAPGADGAGDRLMFQTNSFSGRDRILELWTVGAQGGLPVKAPVPYGANGAVSADGQWLAYTPHSIDTRTWKRYRGGMATDIWLYSLRDGTSRKITDWEGMDTLPMWQGSTVYYLSDQGASHKLNLWSFDTATGRRAQVTNFDEFDVKWPSIGPGPNGRGEIVFQYGPRLQLLDLGTNVMRAVDVTIPGDRPRLRERATQVSGNVSDWDISPSAKRVAVAARGDLWTLPAKHGSARNLTRTSGANERTVSWSPDGKSLAYLSDETGEYELYTRPADGKGEPKRLTHDGRAFRYLGGWSPDSKKIVLYEKSGEIKLIDAESGDVTLVDTDPLAQGPVTVNWSHDSAWITYERGDEENRLTSVWLYNLESGEKHRVTGPMFSSQSPVFDRKGDYLYFATNRAFAPMYGELDTGFIYAGTEVIAAAPLRKDVKHPLLPKSDEEEGKKDDKKDKDKADGAKKDNGDDEKGGDKAKDEAAQDDGVSGTWTGTATGGPLPAGGAAITMTLDVGADGSVKGSLSAGDMAGTIKSGTYDKGSGALTLELEFPGGVLATITGTIEGKSFTGRAISPQMPGPVELKAERTAGAKGGDQDGAGGKDSKPREKVTIDLEGLEGRTYQLAIPRGSFGQVAVNDKGELIYARIPTRGAEGSASVKLFDPADEKQEEKEVASGGGGFILTADGKHILLVRGSSALIGPAQAGSKTEAVVTAGMLASIDPRAEWRQVFNEAWRIQRDFFYDPTMHGVDWPAMRERYGKMVDDCASREDVGYVISEMISELNVGHAYYQAGASGEETPTMQVGLLGCDFELAQGEGGASAYRIARIIRGAPWDLDARGPLTAPGVDVKEGDYLLAVNGAPLDTAKDPWAAFQGVVGRGVTITVSEEPILNDKARDVVVEPVANDYRIRYRDWIERKRRHVEERTGGKVGYIYVPSTGVDGQNDLVRMFYGQKGKQALIIDERWNSGGQIPTRFVELLNRPVTNYWARRDGVDWMWPPDAHFGPKCMLINGLSGSGGDAFPAYFRQAGLGKLIGTRTWGGLVGISGNPGLVDGAGVTAPTFGYYENDGTWGIEGHGVDPDIMVIDDPAQMKDGADPQLDAAIEHILGEIQRTPYRAPKRPTYPNRSGMGLPDSDR